MKILLFGSTGMVGTAVEVVCQRKHIDCISLNHNDIDITDYFAVERIIDKYSPDAVVNSVAVIGINLCEDNPALAFEINAIAVYHLAKYAEHKEIILVQPSSHAVFDGLKDGYYTEDDRPNPINVYSLTKYMAEVFTQKLCKRHYIIRFPTLFGPRKNKSLGFVDKVFEKIKKGEKLQIANDKIDSPTYTLDAVEQLIFLLEEKMPYGIYHLANSGKVSYYDFVKNLKDLLGNDVELSRAKDRDFPASGYKPLKTAMKSIKLPPLRPWEDALAEYVNNYLKEALR